MLNAIVFLALLVVGTALLFLLAWGCYLGGAWLSRLLWRVFFERLER